VNAKGGLHGGDAISDLMAAGDVPGEAGFGHDEALPTLFGPYLLLTRLAQGGMGEVFLAKSEGIVGIEKVCVVKRLRPHLTGDSEYVARFIDEARIMVQLSHRNICPVFDVGRVDNQYYLVMEFVPGCDLRSFSERAKAAGQPLEPALGLFIVQEVLEALDYAHRHRDPVSGEQLALVHRDVSPQNVMLNGEGETKLIDFGLVMSTRKTEQTNPNTVMGKISYMAPEHARGEHVDGRTDQFAAAIMLYELLCQERYYAGLGTHEVWAAAGMGGHVPLRWSTFDAELQTILSRALAPEPDDRYPTCAAFSEALREYAYAKNLRASTRDVRERVQALFGPDLNDTRLMLQRFADLTVSHVRGGAQAPKVDVFRIATTTQLSGRTGGEQTELVDRSTSGPAYREHTPTATTGHPPSTPVAPTRSWMPVLAGLAIAGALGIGVAVGLSTGEDPIPPARTPDAPAAADPPLPPVDPAPPAVPPEPVAPPPPGHEPVTSAPPKRAEPQRQDKQRRRRSSSRRRSPAAKAKPEAVLTLPAKLSVIERCGHPCAKGGSKPNLATDTSAQVAAKKRAIDRCYKKCR
jgi:serine/threonine protein kinase